MIGFPPTSHCTVSVISFRRQQIVNGWTPLPSLSLPKLFVNVVNRDVEGLDSLVDPEALASFRGATNFSLIALHSTWRSECIFTVLGFYRIAIFSGPSAYWLHFFLFERWRIIPRQPQKPTAWHRFPPSSLVERNPFTRSLQCAPLCILFGFSCGTWKNFKSRSYTHKVCNIKGGSLSGSLSGTKSLQTKVVESERLLDSEGHVVLNRP